MIPQDKWKVLVVLAVWLQFLAFRGPILSFSVLYVDIQQEFNATAVATSWLGTLSSGLASFASPLAAVVASKIGNLHVVLLGAVLASVGYLTTSFIPSLAYGYLTFGVMSGVGACFTSCASTSVMFDWFSGQENKCRTTGFSLLGGSIGVMVFGPLLNTLTDAYGWRNCMRITSGIILALGFVGALLFLKSPEKSANPPAAGADTSSASDGSREDKCHEETSSLTEQEHRNSNSDEGRHPAILKNVELWLWLSSATCDQVGWSFSIVYFSSFMREIQLTTGQISLVLTASGAAEIGGKILFAMVGDSLPFLQLYLTVATAAGGAVVSGLLTLSSSFEHMIIASIVWGVCRGVRFGSCFIACDELFHVYGSRAVSTVIFLGFGTGIFVGVPITGALRDLTGDYTISLLFLMVAFVLSALGVLLIPVNRRIQARRRRTQRNNSPTAVCMVRKPNVLSVGTILNPPYDTDL